MVHYLIKSKYVILSGNDIDFTTMRKIINDIHQLDFIPCVIYKKDSHDSYILGLKFNACKLLS